MITQYGPVPISKEKEESYFSDSGLQEEKKAPGILAIDSPKDNFAKGVICSAGGHFEGVFKDEDKALAFCREAATKLQTELPGIQYGMQITEFDRKDTFKTFCKKPGTPPDIELIPPVFHSLPFLRISTDDGLNPVPLNEKGKPGPSSLIKLMDNQKKEYFTGNSKEILIQFLTSYLGTKKGEGCSFWENEEFDLEKLAELSKTRNKNQIAIVAIDGNKMGVRFKDYKDAMEKEYPNINVFDAFYEIETFWHNARINVRKALAGALDEAERRKTKTKGTIIPVWPIFLGGDDILLICIPEVAHKLVIDFAKALSECTPSTNSEDKHTISASIAIVKEKFPLAMAHEIAESCLDIAKKKAYQTKDKSCIDWQVVYEARSFDVEEIRRRDYLLKYKNGDKDCIDILTTRPITMTAMESLRKKAEKVSADVKNQGEAGANKHKAVRTILRQGRPMAEWQIEMLGLKDYYSYDDEKKLDNRHVNITEAYDIIELWELTRGIEPGNQDEEGGDHEEAAH